MSEFDRCGSAIEPPGDRLGRLRSGRNEGRREGRVNLRAVVLDDTRQDLLDQPVDQPERPAGAHDDPTDHAGQADEELDEGRRPLV